MELISVIVPIYKVEDYLKECVDSILGQTYDNLEVILVDDGSPDACPSICDDYAVKDNRIRVIHKSNGGLSDARNVGIDVASGEWIAFVDSDDMLHARYIELLHKAAVSNDAKMSWCSIAETDDKGYVGDTYYSEVKLDEEYGTTVYTKQEAELQFFTDEGVQRCLVAWNKLYHRSLFKSEDGPVRYAVGKIFEDGYTTYKYIYGANKVVAIDVNLYYYRQRGGSIMDKASNVKFVPALEAGLQRMDFYQGHNEKELYLTELNFGVHHSIRFYERVKTKAEKKEVRLWFKKYYNRFKLEKWPLGKRVRMWAFAHCYRLYRFISKFEGIYNKLR